MEYIQQDIKKPGQSLYINPQNQTTHRLQHTDQ